MDADTNLFAHSTYHEFILNNINHNKYRSHVSLNISTIGSYLFIIQAK